MKSPSSAKLSRAVPASLVDNPRASLDSWKRFEPYVITAMQRHPQPYILEPTFLSVETFVTRIRDAIRGKLAFDYPSSLSTESVSLWYPQIIIKRFHGSSVYIGTKEKLTAEVSVASEVSTTPTFDSLDASEIAAFALLLSNGRISGPFLVRNPPSLDSYPSHPNFQAIPRPDGSLLLL